MKKKRRQKIYVSHPRYGDKPIVSEEYSYSTEEVAQSYWKYERVTFFPETAIPADTEKQYYVAVPRRLYVDIEEKCETCGRLFLFFAEEQKYWFETLKFYIDAHATRCTDCRVKHREHKDIHKTYQDLLKKTDRTDEETKVLKKAALELYQLGYIKDQDLIDKI